MLLGLWPAFSSAQTVETVINNGASSNRVDMIFIGDGYTASQLDNEYVTHLQSTVDHFFSNGQDPFPRYSSYFNVHRVNIASNESGADKPLDNIYVDTALDASYSWGGSVERCLYFNTGKANTAVATALTGTSIDIDMRIGLVNDAKYGGCGGQWAVLAGANAAAPEIALHEVGHSFASLADEYWYTDDTYSGSEKSNVNLTISPTTGKWDRWLDYVDPDNTTIGAIDYYEGGGYNEFGLYRPSNNSKMRSLNRPFDAISREQFIKRIYEEVDPLDAWLDNSSELDSPTSLWVDSVDAGVINVEWFIDGISLGVLGESIDLTGLGLAEGSHTAEALAYDSILDFSYTGLSLDWWRYDDKSLLQQSVTWTFNVSAVPEPGSLLMVSLLGVGLLNRRRRVD
jgi:hypothetical protein